MGEFSSDSFGDRARGLVTQFFSRNVEGNPEPGSFFFSQTDSPAGPLTITGFVLLGLFLSFHLSQCVAEIPLEWAVLRRDNRQTWFSLYLLQVLLFYRLSLPVVRDAMVHYLATYLDKLHQTPEKRFFSSWLTSPPLPAVAAWLKGREDALLDAFWIALVGVETLLVLGVVMRRIVGRLGGSGGSSRSSSSTSAGAARRENPKAKTT